MRDPLAISFSVWRAIFLREAVDRLFDMRAAWFWLLAEPVMHIGFITFVFTVIRMRTVSNADVVIWIVAGMLAFFLFRRTGTQVSHAVDSNKPFFTYRQLKPFDTVIARAVLEAFVMCLVSAVILCAVALLGHQVLPADSLWVLLAALGLWLFAIGYGLIAAVLIELVPESQHVLKIIMMPMYIISGVIFPLAAIPKPYIDYLMFNPVAHGIELVRAGFFSGYYVVPGTSIAYLYACAISTVFLGLLLFRRYDDQLVMR